MMVVGAATNEAFPETRIGLLRRGEQFIARFTVRRSWAVLTILLLALGARLAVLRIEPIPAPGVHDEFSYLLMGDTFAHGRLTNPTHPMWIHFESMAINQRPTYCSAFYPAQGAFLALGRVVFGHPFWGVWLSTGLMCAAICWALQGWMPPAWAFLGAFLAILRFGVFSYWADSYWGGSVAAIGGALVLGALPRIKRHVRTRDALLLALGFAVLANSRPYEGVFYCAPFLVALAIFIVGKKSPPLSSSSRRIVLPVAVTMTLTFAFMAYYFWRTTNNPLRPPYLVNVATYMQDPQFIWGKWRAPLEYHDETMARFYRTHHIQQAVAAQQHPVATIFRRILEFWAFFVGPALTVPLFVLAAILPYGLKFNDLGKTRFLLVLVLVSFVGLLLPVPNFPHYAAPVTCATLTVLIQTLRRVWVWGRSGNRKGLWVVRAVVTFCIVGFIMVTWQVSVQAARGQAVTLGRLENSFLRFDLKPHNTDRMRIVRALSHRAGGNLILVHYSPNHNPHEEWVYNDADIDNSKIVWARETNLVENERLISYFSNRRVWLLQADGDHPSVVNYSAPGLATAAGLDHTPKGGQK